MELWWNLDILWWNLDRFEHKFDGNITNWPCWSEGKLGTGPFTWLGQGFQTNFSEIPFQKRENLSIYGQNYGQLRSNGDFWRSCNRKKKGFMFTPVNCNASRNIIYIDLVVARSCTLVKQCHQNTTISLPQYKYKSTTTILAQYYYHNTSSKVLLQYYYCFSSAPTMVLRALSMLKNDVQSFQQ